MISKKKLFTEVLPNAVYKVAPMDLCRQLSNVGKLQLNHRYISNETYGRDSMIYITVDTPETRFALEDELEANGVKVQRDYWPGNPRLAVQVSYFKGHNWDE